MPRNVRSPNTGQSNRLIPSAIAVGNSVNRASPARLGARKIPACRPSLRSAGRRPARVVPGGAPGGAAVVVVVMGPPGLD